MNTERLVQVEKLKGDNRKFIHIKNNQVESIPICSSTYVSKRNS